MKYMMYGLYEITNHAEPRCYTVEYNIQTVYMKLQIMLTVITCNIKKILSVKSTSLSFIRLRGKVLYNVEKIIHTQTGCTKSL